MTKHTPGPWTATGWKQVIVNSPDEVTIAAYPSGRKNCPLDEVQANARLIAAAPELLKACQAAASFIGHSADAMDWCGCDDCRIEWAIILPELEAAIAKATGQV